MCVLNEEKPMTLEQLTLNGATTLLTYLQCARLTNEGIGAEALAATLCEMLNQIEATHPGITQGYGWKKVISPETSSERSWESNQWESNQIDHDLHRF